MVAPHHTLHDQPKAVAKTVVKLAHHIHDTGIKIVNDQCIKSNTRLTCKDGDFTQKMLSGIWPYFFSNPENKKDLIKLACPFSKQMNVVFV